MKSRSHPLNISTRSNCNLKHVERTSLDIYVEASDELDELVNQVRIVVIYALCFTRLKISYPLL